MSKKLYMTAKLAFGAARSLGYGFYFAKVSGIES
jgi:hypothetical protein